MSEILNECELHPTEDVTFKQSVMRALIGRQALNFLGFRRGYPENQPLSYEIITALGVDQALSTLVNECAQRLVDGTCTRFVIEASEGFSVRVGRRPDVP